MRFDIITLFPEMFKALTDFGVTARAKRKSIYSLVTWNPRNFTDKINNIVDDRPYGGGPGMVMLAYPLENTLNMISKSQAIDGIKTQVVLLSPQGKTLTHQHVIKLANKPGLTILCGRYEAIDQRLIDRCVDEEISIGDFVLSGGELPAMVLLDAIIRQLPGVLSNNQSVLEESFVNGLLDHPHYTRPYQYKGCKVPQVLINGNHKKIIEWRRMQSLLITLHKRPDLLEIARNQGLLTYTDENWITSIIENKMSGI